MIILISFYIKWVIIDDAFSSHLSTECVGSTEVTTGATSKATSPRSPVQARYEISAKISDGFILFINGVVSFALITETKTISS